jgi:hypothetical protein
MDRAARNHVTNCVITTENSEDRHREIIQSAVAKRAYQIFETRGYKHGSDLEDWMSAEKELLRDDFGLGLTDPNPNGTSANPADDFQPNLIMPEPTFFLHEGLGPVSIIRPTSTAQGGAVASVISFVEDRLFLDPATGNNTGIVDRLMRLAEEADEARRGF